MAKAKDATQEPTSFGDQGPAYSTDGLKQTDEIEIRHPKTGQTYGVSVKAFKDLYEPLGFEAFRMGDNSLLPSDPRVVETASAPAAVFPETQQDQPTGEIPVDEGPDE